MATENNKGIPGIREYESESVYNSDSANVRDVDIVLIKDILAIIAGGVNYTPKKTLAIKLIENGSVTEAINYDTQTNKEIRIPGENVRSILPTLALRRSNRIFTAKVKSYNDGTPYRILALTDYSSFDDTPMDGDILHLWVPTSIAASSTSYPVFIAPSSSAENSRTNAHVLYHGQSAGEGVYWKNTTALTNGFYAFVWRSDITDSNLDSAVSGKGGWVFLYRNTSTT